MKCPRCRHDNRAGAKFCEQCANPLARSCMHCGSALPDTAKFCSECAHPVAELSQANVGGILPAQGQPAAIAPQAGAAAKPHPEGERRQAAVLFADISGYTSLCAKMDGEQVQGMLSKFYEVMDGIVADYGGHVIDHAGDGVLAVFGAPVAHGDDAERAVRAALDMHSGATRVLDGTGTPLQLHVGLAGGEVVAAVIAGGTQPRYSVTGDIVNLAARLGTLAQPRDTLIAEGLYTSVSHLVKAEALGEHAIRGFERPMPVWRVHSLQTARAQRTLFVGRQAQIRQLQGIIDGTQETARGQTVLVRGEAGIGKSRLVEHLRAQAQAQGYECCIGHVLDFGVGRRGDAIAMILRQLLDVAATGDESALVAAVDRGLHTGELLADEETFVNALLEVPQRPEQRALLDALDNATRGRRTGEVVAGIVKRAALRRPLLVVVEDVHWGTPALMEYLSLLCILAPQCQLILALTSRIEGDPLTPIWRASTRGSPLMTIDLGPLRPEEAHFMAGERIEVSTRVALRCIERSEGNPLFLEQLLRNACEAQSVNVPPTIQSLVLARMDRLAVRDKSALQAAAVLGKRFTLDALRFVAADPVYRCDALLSADLARPDGGEFLFAHALIQEGVYSSLLKTRKRELHARAAEHFAHDERILHAEHLDRAEDPRAAQAYFAAATEQHARFAYQPALQLVERGLELTGAGETRHGLGALHGELLRELARSQDSIAAYQAALESAGEDDQRCRALMGIAAGYRITGDAPAALDALDRAERIADRLGLAVESSRIHFMRGNLLFAQGQGVACRAAHEKALEQARVAGNVECEAQALSGLADSYYAQGRMLTALSYFRRCVELCERHGLMRFEVPNRAMVGHCLYYSNDLDAAVLQARAACETAMRAGLIQAEIMTQESVGIILLDAARYDEADQALRRSEALARQAGARRYLSIVLYALSRIAYARGRIVEAREMIDESLAFARQTGMGFLGAAVYGGIARIAQDPQQRRRALHEGEALLGEECIAHSHFWFCRSAIDVMLELDDWQEVRRHAAALEEYAQQEPLPWTRLVVARGRALADLGEFGMTSARALELQEIRAEVQRGAFASLLPTLEAALAAV